jgi:hypothetical protein
MATSLPPHVEGLLTYLSRPHEKANEDLALTYFRKVFGSSFTRQEDAQRADGYVAGSFVLELKGRSGNWLSGLFQGLAYRNKGLDFSQIVVAANTFLAVWRVDELDPLIREQVALVKDPPSKVGAFFARKYSRKAKDILKRAIWRADVELGSLFRASDPALTIEKIKSFEHALREGRKVRQTVTLKNFISVLREMKEFFDPDQPVKAVRAFYSMVYAWKETSTLQLSVRNSDVATLEGETITNLMPSRRTRFKDFVDNHYVRLGPAEDIDDFFARYDEALDAIDKDFRVKNGMFFTDRDLSKFVMWLVKQHIPHLGKNYLVIDPACGSGNLVTNWRSPLELRHKVVSEIEPELLFAVEKRMKGDQWHNGKFTVVPKTSENRGLNFLDKSAEEYLRELRVSLDEKGHKPDKPLAFLCNPPYRNDDDQGAKGINYKVHESIVKQVGMDASSERYCCFLAQMKLICDAARSSGLPDDSLLLLFTKSTWLTRRPMFEEIRSQMLGAFDNVTGVLVKGNEFFDVKGSWPVAFTLWRYKGKGEKLNTSRSIPLLDLTWLTKRQLSSVPWDKRPEMERACESILQQADEVQIGVKRINIRDWSGKSMTDFKRDRRKSEKNARVVGGLPLNDTRHNLKKAHGATDGLFIGFMDDLTPCRVKKSTPDRPWFYLDNRFMSIRQARCLSGPPTHLGYCAEDLDSAKKLFLWFALAKTFLQERYPMWIDADNLWAPNIPASLERRVLQSAFAIAYAENDCVETRFPANNPVRGVCELSIRNPMSPLNEESFWLTTVRPYCDRAAQPTTRTLIGAVDQLFAEWGRVLSRGSEVCISRQPYLLDDDPLTLGAGIIQIRDFARESDEQALLRHLARVQASLKSAKSDFFELVTAKNGLNYFGLAKKPALRTLTFPSKIEPKRPPQKRLAVAVSRGSQRDSAAS